MLLAVALDVASVDTDDMIFITAIVDAEDMSAGHRRQCAFRWSTPILFDPVSKCLHP